jgi:hypothetical protein
MLRVGGTFIMALISETNFSTVRVELDGKQFEHCTFDRCAIVFKASSPYKLNGCTFNDCSFHFEGAAALTIRFMTDLYPIAPELIEGTFDKIRLKV